MSEIKDLPKHWAIKTLGEVCEIKNGKNQKAVINPNGKYPIYGSAGIMGFANQYLCEEGTTIVGRKGTINKPIYVKTKFWNVDTAFGFSPFKKIIESRFLFFFCQSFNFHKLDKSTTIPSLAKTDLQKIELVVPPLPEQQAIVAKIEELLSELENGKQQLQTAQQQLKVYRQSVLKWAFEGKLTNKNVKEGELPKGWKRKTLGNVISISSGNGLTRTKRDDEGNYLVYGGNGVTGKHSEYLFEDEKLIIGRVGVHCGNAHITKPKSWVTDNAFIVSFHEKEVNRNFLLHLIKVLNLNKYSVSTAQPVISQGKLYPIEVSIPPLQEQQLIVSELESKLTVCDKIEETISQNLQQAETLKQSILKKAFEGRLV
jgi:type I restriction enzyme S subunit